jgi:hypothetical protein
MKKILASVMAIYSLLITGQCQTIAPVRQSAIGISFTLTDFLTAQRIRSTSLTSVLNDKAWAKIKEMSTGLALSYYKGLMPKIDFAATFPTNLNLEVIAFWESWMHLRNLNW